MLDYLLIIPARYDSKRLPGKPLLDINYIKVGYFIELSSV